MEQTPPFFIGCMARSGSTLLRMMLDSHPRIYVGPETRWYRNPDPGRFLEGMRQESPKPCWGDKSPKTIFRENLERLVEIFDDRFRLISIHRHPADVYSSWVRSGKFRSDEKFFQRYRRVLDGTQFARERLRDQLLEVGYEDLVADPERVLRSVTDFIGCEFDARMLSWHEDDHDLLPNKSYSERRATQKLFTTSVDQHREVLEGREAVKRALQPFCDLYGYSWDGGGRAASAAAGLGREA